MKLKSAIRRCMRCGFCRAGCPLFRETLSDGSTARGKLQTLLALLEGEIPASRRALLRLFECTTCGACSELCPAGVRFEEVLEAARRSFLRELELPVHEWMVEATLSTGNPFAREFEASVRRGGTAFFPGCTSHFRVREIESSCIRLLERYVKELSVLRMCCGAPLLYFGGEAEEFFERNMQLLEGFELIVAHCPTCTKVLREHYRVQVLHISQALLELGTEPVAPALRAAYHDPCHLARGCGVVEEPRELLLRAGVELVELEHSRRATDCCGAGGGLPVSFPELSARLAARRQAEAVSLGAGALLTFCPTCYLHLSSTAGESLRVLDASVLLAGGVHEVRREY